MSDKYLIFSRNNIIRPVFVIDKVGNSKILELTKDEAMEYVERKNKVIGKFFFYCMSMDEWQNQIKQSMDCEDYDDKFQEELYKQIMENSDLRKKINDDIQERDNNINGFSLPIVVRSNKEYKEKLKQKLMDYANAINKPAFKSENNLICDVENICNTIINTLDLIISGKCVEADKLLADLIDSYLNHEFGVTELDKCYAFRGVSPLEKLYTSVLDEELYEDMMNDELDFFRGRVEDKDKVEDIKGIISLPYCKKELSKDLRFSLKGEICLYLGATSYVCSQECRWDKSQKMYISAFRFNEEGKKLRILNLTISEALINGVYQKGIDNEYKSKLQDMMIRLFPLVIATSFTVTSSDNVREKDYKEKVKYEYLLSQRLIKAIQMAKIDGVAYLSRQGANDFQYPHGVNLAIPMNDISEDKEYSDLYKCFKITKPVLINDKIVDTELPWGEVSYINKKYTKYLSGYGDNKFHNTMAEVKFGGENVFYGEISYSKMDNYLVSQKYDYFEI